MAKHYSAVGKTGYTKQVVNHLETLLRDEVFASRLDETEGKLVFRNGILDLRTEEFREGLPQRRYDLNDLGARIPKGFVRC